jgi:hypothetical protein
MTQTTDEPTDGSIEASQTPRGDGQTHLVLEGESDEEWLASADTVDLGVWV